MRSPNYPALTLSDAVEAVKILWEKEKKTAVDVQTIATAWGYSSVSGRVRTKLGALRKYGLVDDTPNGTKVSDLAVRIIYADQNSEDQLAALREAALRPSLFRELYESHSEASENAIKSYLVVKKGFSDAGAKEAARSFHATVEVSQLEGSSYTPRGTTSEDGEDEMATTPEAQTTALTRVTPIAHVNIADGKPNFSATVIGASHFHQLDEHPVGASIPVSADCKMSVWATGDVSQAGIEKLIKYLELIKDSFPTDEQIAARFKAAIESLAKS